MSMKLYNIDGKWEYKLPYIPDPNMFKAVMGTIDLLKWHREKGHKYYFQRSVNRYARKYNVDPEEVERYVRIARSRTQKIEH